MKKGLSDLLYKLLMLNEWLCKNHSTVICKIRMKYWYAFIKSQMQWSPLISLHPFRLFWLGHCGYDSSLRGRGQKAQWIFWSPITSKPINTNRGKYTFLGLFSLDHPVLQTHIWVAPVPIQTIKFECCFFCYRGFCFNKSWVCYDRVLYIMLGLIFFVTKCCVFYGLSLVILFVHELLLFISGAFV